MFKVSRKDTKCYFNFLMLTLNKFCNYSALIADFEHVFN